MTDDPRPHDPFPPAQATPGAVSLDKSTPAGQRQEAGASPWAAAQDAATGAANAAQQAVQGGLNSFQAQGDVAQRRLIAGLLGIFLGSLGVHKFYLGMTQAGLIMLGLTIGGWILGIVGSLVIVGAIFFVIPWAVGLLGLVEGILYLTKSDADFQRDYLSGRKPWL